MLTRTHENTVEGCRMFRFAWLVVAACGPLSAHSTETAQASEPTDQPPNVVMIISDDQSWTDYGFANHPVIKSPRLDQLATQSAVFPRGYVPTALCRPSLATMITGLYAHQHRISGNDPTPAAGVKFSRDDPRYPAQCQALIEHIDPLPTLPKLLANHGYVSFQSGKWWEGNHCRGGFTAGMTHGDPQRGGRHGDVGLQIGRNGMQPIFDFIDSAEQKPFFLWYAPFLPHSPHNPPPRLLQKYEQPGRPLPLARYYAMCEWFDETCGQLLDYLDQHGLCENTLVVYVTDNGWIQRTEDTQVPEGWKSQFAPKSKQSPNEGGIRTPIMLRWPGKIQPHQYETLVSSVDLAPTILQACGVQPPTSMPGINLLDVCNGATVSREAIFGESFAHDIADIQDPTRSLLNLWCIEGNWKLILFQDGQLGRYQVVHQQRPREPQLYDLSVDPHETRNVAAQHPATVARMTDKIRTWWPEPFAKR